MISAEEQKANQMIIAGDLAGARPILVQLCVDNPDNATYQYRAACVHDGLGLEKEALPYYQEAFKLGGLSNEDLEGAYVGLGSTYRVLGYFAKSAEVLIEGSKRFPNSQCMKIFEAMTLHESGRHNLAVAMLLLRLQINPVMRLWRYTGERYSSMRPSTVKSTNASV
ncbi:MAG: tetratricopeptide repeat protein [Candidatus Obscuribacterales bacterium]